MTNKSLKVSVDILVIKDNKILLGLLSKKWVGDKTLYGVPGRDIHFKETIGEAVKRDIKEEINCEVKEYKIICVNSNSELGNHYIGIGVIVEIRGEIELLKPADWEKWEWFNKDQIPQNLFAPAKNLITCFLTNKINVSE